MYDKIFIWKMVRIKRSFHRMTYEDNAGKL